MDDLDKYKLEKLEKDFEKLEDRFNKYVTNERFSPVQLLVYGITGMLLLSVIATVLVNVAGLVVPS